MYVEFLIVSLPSGVKENRIGWDEMGNVRWFGDNDDDAN